MRQKFFDLLYQKMKKDKRIIFIAIDLGYGYVDKIKNELPDQFINTGASEQAALGIACGLALEGMIPIVYSISPFLIYRGFETIRNYINHEAIPVKLIGSGRSKDYEHDGFSHWIEEDEEVMSIFNNIKSFWPPDEEILEDIINAMFVDRCPYYINLKR
jgi:transketolase